MATATLDCDTPTVINVETGHSIVECQKCHIHYDWRKSSSGSLKMTYCGFMCELADQGFTIEDVLHWKKSTPSDQV